MADTKINSTAGASDCDFCPGAFPTTAEEFLEALNEAMEHDSGLDVQECCIQAGLFYSLVDPDRKIKF